MLVGILATYLIVGAILSLAVAVRNIDRLAIGVAAMYCTFVGDGTSVLYKGLCMAVLLLCVVVAFIAASLTWPYTVYKNL